MYSSFNITNKFSEGKHFNLPQNNYISILSGYEQKERNQLFNERQKKRSSADKIITMLKLVIWIVQSQMSLVNK